MEEQKDRIKGIIAAVLFLLLLFTLSVFLGFYYPDPPVPDTGVVIEMGGSGAAGGDLGRQVIPEPEPRPETTPQPVSRPAVTTSTESPYTAPVTTPAREPRETEVVQPEQPARVPDPNAAFPARGSSTQAGAGTSRGDRAGTGTGTSTGDGTGEGVGRGSGPSFSLVGRTARSLPLPEYRSDSQGKVVIDVRVDQEGNVIDAVFNPRESTTADPQLRRAALEAARRSRFSVQLDAAVVQRGTITYQFIKQN